MNGSPTLCGSGLGRPCRGGRTGPAEAAAPELVAPARAARRELGLREVAHEGAEDVEEALHFFADASTASRVTVDLGDDQFWT